MFTEEQFSCIARIIVKANPDAAAHLESLRSVLSDLLIAVGVAVDGTEYGREFGKLAAEDDDHSEKARRFAKIATSGNPLKPTLYTGTMMGELYAVLRCSSKRPHAAARTTTVGRLPVLHAQWSAAEIQAAARHLKTFHKLQAKRGRRTKVQLDTLVEELAEIFAINTGFAQHRRSLPDTDDSYFIQFCRAILAPHVAPSEATLKALSRRWQRLKDDASRPAESVKRAPKRRLHPRKRSEATAA